MTICSITESRKIFASSNFWCLKTYRLWLILAAFSRNHLIGFANMFPFFSYHLCGLKIHDHLVIACVMLIRGTWTSLTACSCCARWVRCIAMWSQALGPRQGLKLQRFFPWDHLEDKTRKPSVLSCKNIFLMIFTGSYTQLCVGRGLFFLFLFAVSWWSWDQRPKSHPANLVGARDACDGAYGD